MKIELKQLNINMAEQEYEMLQGILDIENGFTNPAYNLSYKKYKKWLQEVDNHSQGIDLPTGWIPYTTYFLYVDDIPVGYGRGQSLSDTLKFMEKNVLNKNNCYLPETIPLCEEMNGYTNNFFKDLSDGIQ